MHLFTSMCTYFSQQESLVLCNMQEQDVSVTIINTWAKYHSCLFIPSDCEDEAECDEAVTA